MPSRTEASIDIEALPPAIMDVIADLPNYPEWSEGVQAVEVLTRNAEGLPATAHFTFDAGLIKDNYDLTYSWNGTHSVSWQLTNGHVIKSMDGTYTLDIIGDHTKVSYELSVELTVPMLGVMKRMAEQTIIDTALKGLKKRVEG